MTEPDPNMEIVTIFESDDPVAFSLATGALDEAGVEFAVIEEALTGFGFSPMVNPMRRIQIPASRKDQALELIEGVYGAEDSDPAGDEAAQG